MENQIRELTVSEIDEVNGAALSAGIVLGVMAVGRAYATNAAFRSAVNTSAQWAAGTALGAYAVDTFNDFF